MRTEFNVVVPLVKASKDDKGRWWVHGVASDETLDLQGEITPPAALKQSLPYLREFGKFNDDHSRTNVGEVLQANIVTKGSLVKQGVLEAAKVPEEKWVDEALYVAGPLYKHVERARYYRDVLRSGGRLGLSIQGKVLEKPEVVKSADGRTIGVHTKCFVNKIAITDQPVNPSTWCALRKSLSAGETEQQFIRALAKGLQKALEKGVGVFTTGSGIVQAGETGGRALRKQELEGAGKARKRRRKTGGVKMATERECAVHVTDVAKSLGGLSSQDVQTQISNLLKPPRKPGSEAVGVNWPWVQDLYDDYAIVSKNGKNYRYPFTVSGAKVTLGEPEEVIRSWQVAPRQSQKSLAAQLGPLDVPVRIAKAWSRLADPGFIGDADANEYREAASAVREAAKSKGLTYAVQEDRRSPMNALCKSLTEPDMRALEFLASATDEQFRSVVDADIEALEKSRGTSSEKPGEQPEEEDNDMADLSKMSADELKAFAKEKGIDLSDLDKEELDDPDILREEIEDQLEDQEEPEEEETEGKEAVPTEKSLATEPPPEPEAPAAPELPDDLMDASPVLQSLSKSLDGLNAGLEGMPTKIAETLATGLVEGLAKALGPMVERLEAVEKGHGEIQQSLDHGNHDRGPDQ